MSSFERIYISSSDVLTVENPSVHIHCDTHSMPEPQPMLERIMERSGIIPANSEAQQKSWEVHPTLYADAFPVTHVITVTGNVEYEESRVIATLKQKSDYVYTSCAAACYNCYHSWIVRFLVFTFVFVACMFSFIHFIKPRSFDPSFGPSFAPTLGPTFAPTF